MSKSRLPIYLGVGAVSIGGYYLYSAGGDPKVAQKKLEHDASSASAKLKHDLPGSGKEAQKQGEVWAQSAGSTLDKTVSDARAKVNEADAKIGAKFSEADTKLHNLAAEGKSQLQQATKDTGRELKQTADNFDHLVEKKASEAKSGISNWFGFGK